MPRTTFRLRVAPILHIEQELMHEKVDDENNEAIEKGPEKKKTYKQEWGSWSEIVNIATLEASANAAK
jgi:hypothetical protein